MSVASLGRRNWLRKPKEWEAEREGTRVRSRNIVSARLLGIPSYERSKKDPERREAKPESDSTALDSFVLHFSIVSPVFSFFFSNALQTDSSQINPCNKCQSILFHCALRRLIVQTLRMFVGFPYLSKNVASQEFIYVQFLFTNSYHIHIYIYIYIYDMVVTKCNIVTN